MTLNLEDIPEPFSPMPGDRTISGIRAYYPWPTPQPSPWLLVMLAGTPATVYAATDCYHDPTLGFPDGEAVQVRDTDWLDLAEQFLDACSEAAKQGMRTHTPQDGESLRTAFPNLTFGAAWHQPLDSNGLPPCDYTMFEPGSPEAASLWHDFAQAVYALLADRDSRAAEESSGGPTDDPTGT